MQRDEALAGLAKGFAFRMVEALGVLPRAAVANEVKALDQDARGALRKHGIRFGQFTIFMPLLLKPAPTRLRLVLWSLSQGLSEFPEAPPPGLVTLPAMVGGPEGADTMAGYRNAGERAIRIDMLERLADMLRGENSRSGFEANADMLSITGMTLEQFADLMTGLGYKAEKGEREKVKAAPVETMSSDAPKTGADEQTNDELAADASAPEEADQKETALPAGQSEGPATERLDQAPVKDATATDAPEIEVFYTFTWGRPAGNNPRGRGAPKGAGKPRGKGKPQGKGRPKGDRKPSGNKSQNFSARPPKPEKKIDPDNPFAAALMGLRDDK